jgi:hypothetical protein
LDTLWVIADSAGRLAGALPATMNSLRKILLKALTGGPEFAAAWRRRANI